MASMSHRNSEDKTSFENKKFMWFLKIKRNETNKQ